MTIDVTSFTAMLLGLVLCASIVRAEPTAKNVYEFSVKNIRGEDVALEQYRGKVLLIANTASKCGFTPQYSDFQALYERYHERGLEILAFPSNDFLWQEPGSNEEIQSFCSANYQITFPLFSKIHVRGKKQEPLFRYLTTNADPSGGVLWNFEKFLVDKKGVVRQRFRSRTKPTAPELVEALEALVLEAAKNQDKQARRKASPE